MKHASRKCRGVHLGARNARRLNDLLVERLKRRREECPHYSRYCRRWSGVSGEFERASSIVRHNRQWSSKRLMIPTSRDSSALVNARWIAPCAPWALRRPLATVSTQARRGNDRGTLRPAVRVRIQAGDPDRITTLLIVQQRNATVIALRVIVRTRKRRLRTKT